MKNRHLSHPDWPGIQTKRGEVIPFELCHVRPGQFYKKKLTPEMTTRVLNFSKKRPKDRFNAIESGVKVCMSLSVNILRAIKWSLETATHLVSLHCPKRHENQ